MSPLPLPLLELVVGEGALVGVALGDGRQVVAPLDPPHVRRLRPALNLALGDLQYVQSSAKGGPQVA